MGECVCVCEKQDSVFEEQDSVCVCVCVSQADDALQRSVKLGIFWAVLLTAGQFCFHTGRQDRPLQIGRAHV